MKLFAALERALLARWRKIKVALKINKWPLLSLKEQQLQLKKQYLESLFRKKWQKFVRSINDASRTQVPPWVSMRLRNKDVLYAESNGWDCQVRRYHRSQSQLGRIRRGMRLSIVMWASVGISVESRESLTIMWDSDKSCGNPDISWQSQIGLL